ncbi:MAG: hypothetical protein ACYCS3_03440 [Acidithiobacillus sp.]
MAVIIGFMRSERMTFDGLFVVSVYAFFVILLGSVLAWIPALIIGILPTNLHHELATTSVLRTLYAGSLGAALYLMRNTVRE